VVAVSLFFCSLLARVATRRLEKMRGR